MNRCKIFPKLDGPSGYLNLGLHAQQSLGNILLRANEGQNPLLEPNYCNDFVTELQEHAALTWSYGGWLEDRSALWRGSYLEKGKKFLHLGVDFNAPAGTEVALSRSAVVLEVDDDHPEKHGWGKRIIVGLEHVPIKLIYAHLDAPMPPGGMLPAGTVIGTIAPPERNGYWYPHVHVQAMTNIAYERYLKRPSMLDGYGPLTDAGRLAKLFPDPMQWVDMV